MYENRDSHPQQPEYVPQYHEDPDPVPVPRANIIPGETTSQISYQ